MKKITILFLLLAGFSLVSCSRNESGVKEETKAAAPAAVSEGSQQLLSLLPAKNEVPGWAMSQKARSFKSANLWEFIDGAADGYLVYGFQEVVSADYAQEGTGVQAVVDVYQMKDPLNAFGIYTQERNPEYQFVKIGNEGYTGGTSLNFWAGQYYVKITTFEEKDAIIQEMTKLANAVAGKVPTPGAEPAEASYFPKANQLAHTIVYIPKDVLAQSYLYNGFEAKYKAGDKEYKIILISMESPAAAQDAMARYRQFHSTGGKEVKELKAPGDGGFSGKDSFYGAMAAVRAGRNIVVALGVPSEDVGKKQIAELVGNIKSPR
jgi:hypothetical protein